MERVETARAEVQGPVQRRQRELLAVNAANLVAQLHELIAALDSRAPRVERAGEVEIAREAAALKSKALTRLAQLTERQRR